MKRRRTSGFLVMEMVVALLMITALVTAVVMALAHQRRAERQLQTRRADYRQAEAAADALAAGQPAPAGAQVEWLPDASPVSDRAWARITMGSARLVTLAPHGGGGR